MIMRRAYLLLFLIAPFTVLAQVAGKVRLLVDPGHNFKFVVDKQFKMEQREVELSEGLHDFSVWAPERMVVDTPVFVVAGRTTDLVVRLPYSPEFKAYSAATGDFETKRRWYRAAPIVVGAGGLIWTTIGYTKYSKAKKALEADRTKYDINADPGDIARLKGEVIPQHNEDLAKARRTIYAGASITAIGAFATYYIMRKTAKWERPIFNDQEKIKFDGLAWVPSDQGNFFMAGLTLSLGK